MSALRVSEAAAIAIVEHFKATGPGWQTRIDTTLRKAIRKRA